MTTVNIQGNKDKKETHQYKIGQYYLLRELGDDIVEYCILAQVGSGKIALIGLQNGNRWAEPVVVESGSSNKISEEDFAQCLGYSCDVVASFIKSVNISYEL